MFDFHVHVAASGGLLPAEAMRLARNAGFVGVGLVVRADQATLPALLPALAAMVKTASLHAGIEAFAGVELAHVPPPLLPDAVAHARELGAAVVLGHGEGIPFSTLDTVERGSNLAAIEAGVDILAHPGLITAEDATRAAERGVLLELSLAPRHSLANGHVARMAERHGCGLLIGGNFKTAADFVSPQATRALYRAAAAGAGVSPQTTEMTARTFAQALLRACQGRP